MSGLFCFTVLSRVDRLNSLNTDGVRLDGNMLASDSQAHLSPTNYYKQFFLQTSGQPG